MSYVPQYFAVSDEKILLDFMREFDFATVVSGGPNGLVTSHIPVLARPLDDTIILVGHMARANHHWRQMDGATPAIAIFHGPHGYVSPTWYQSSPSVPTWNYGVVHAHGFPTVNEAEGFAQGVIVELVRRYEGEAPDGWRAENVPIEFYHQMLQGIVAFEMPVMKLDGKFKLGQNRSAEDRRRTISALQNVGSPEAAALAEFMQQHAGL